MPRRRQPLSAARRIVVKLGTQVLTHDDGRMALGRLFQTIEEVDRAWRQGRELIVVSSGAVGLGRDALGLSAPPADLALRQACAAVGQVRLMGLWETGFARLGRHAAQLLLTQDDFDDRARYLELRAAVSALLDHGVVPIVNENDVVRTDELRFVDALPEARPVFGDNDKLSALVATKLGADLLVLLTDVEGVFARDPRQDPDAPLRSELSLDGPAAGTVDAAGTGSAAGRGGMASKLRAARIATRSGCQVVIASGRQPDNLARILAGDVVGTWCPARPGLDARRRWIAFATAPRGVLRLDAGAVAALRDRGASLLAAGVTAVEGEFSAGEVVLLRGPDGAEVGRGAVSCDAATARAWSAGHAPSGTRHRHALVHRDQLVLEPQAQDAPAPHPEPRTEPQTEHHTESTP